MTLRVPARPEYLALVRMVMAGAVRIEPVLDDERVDDLRVIVSEACTNAIEALRDRVGPGADGDPDDAGDADGDDGRVGEASILVECRITDDTVAVTVVDDAAGFDLSGLETLPEATDPSRLRIERGLGIPLIRALSDESEIVTGPNGTRVHVVLHGGEPTGP